MSTLIQVKKYNCAVEYTLDVVAGKWKALIIWHLRDGRKRFGELHKVIPDITHKMLIQKLKELEAHNLVAKEVYPQVPPRVEYFITPQGESLYPVLDLLYNWGLENSK